MEIKQLKTNQELEIIFPIVKELRPHLSFEEYIYLVREAENDNQYKLVGIFENNLPLAVMGYRILFDFVHGKHLYIDDLVVTQSLRSKGYGEMLLEYAEREAKKLDCKWLRLSTGIENERGKKFYERCGWKMRSVTYKKKL